MTYRTKDDLPATYNEFVETLGTTYKAVEPNMTYDLAREFDALRDCEVCSEDIIDVDAFAEGIGALRR